MVCVCGEYNWRGSEKWIFSELNSNSFFIVISVMSQLPSPRQQLSFLCSIFFTYLLVPFKFGFIHSHFVHFSFFIFSMCIWRVKTLLFVLLLDICFGAHKKIFSFSLYLSTYDTVKARVCVFYKNKVTLTPRSEK